MSATHIVFSSFIYVFGCVPLSLVVFFWFHFPSPLSSSFHAVSPSLPSSTLCIFGISRVGERKRESMNERKRKGARGTRDALVDR